MDNFDESSARAFLEDIARRVSGALNLAVEQKKAGLAVATHAFANTYPYLQTLDKLFSLKGIVLKGSKDLHPHVVTHLKEQLKLPVCEDLGKKELKGLDATTNLFRGHLKDEENFIIVQATEAIGRTYGINWADLPGLLKGLKMDCKNMRDI